MSITVGVARAVDFPWQPDITIVAWDRSSDSLAGWPEPLIHSDLSAVLVMVLVDAAVGRVRSHWHWYPAG